MSIINIFTRRAPTISSLEFDAVLQDTFEASVELTEYPIEIGARATDHRVILPFRWSLIGAVSNTPLSPTITDFTGFLPGPAGASGFAAGAPGLVAGLLAGSDNTRSAAALAKLIEMMTAKEVLYIDAGDIQLKNMVISRIRRTKDPENENGLIFEAELQEYPTLATTLSKNAPLVDQLREGDPSQSQASAQNNRGEILGVTTQSSTAAAVTGVIG